MMFFRKATANDINNIMKIINDAKAYFKEMNIDQWQDGYPNEDVIKNDIFNSNSYLLEVDGKIVATAMFAIERDKTYDNIYDGKWLTEGKYAVIHRIAVDNNFKGLKLGAEIINNAIKICKAKGIESIKIDTHKDNNSMQKFLLNNGFEYCGVIYLEDKSLRIAFERKIKI